MKRHWTLLNLAALAVAMPLAGRIPASLPDGTRLENNLVTPIFVELVDPPGDGNVMRVRLKDASGYRVDLFAERTRTVNIDRQTVRTLSLFLFQGPGKTGSVPLEVNSEEEATYLAALSLGLDHYTPGWTQNWSEAGHKALFELVRDVTARRNAAGIQSSPLQRVIGRD